MKQSAECPSPINANHYYHLRLAATDWFGGAEQVLCKMSTPGLPHIHNACLFQHHRLQILIATKTAMQCIKANEDNYRERVGNPISQRTFTGSQVLEQDTQ